MGESYADPSGLIWGDVMRYPNGDLVLPDLPSKAKAICVSIGARLPTQAEYARLSNFLTTGDYYQCSGNSRQVRPFNPFQRNSREDVIPNLSHSASWVYSSDEAGIDFQGLENYVGCKYVAHISGFTKDSVRCVLDQP